MMMAQILSIVCEILLTVACLFQLQDVRIRFNARSIVMVVFDIILLSMCNWGYIPQVFVILIYIWLYYYGKTTFLLTRVMAVRLFITTVCIMSIFQMLATFPVVILERFVENDLLSVLVIHSIVGLFLLVLSKRKILARFMKLIQNSSWNDNMLFLALVMAISFLLPKFKAEKGMSNGSYLLVLLLIVNIVIALIQVQNMKKQLRLKEVQNHMFSIYNSAYEELIQTTRARQHEFRNHINALQGLHYTTATREELIKRQGEYLEPIHNENKFSKLIGSKGSPIVIGFLYTKFMKADEAQIQIDYTVIVDELKGKLRLYEWIEIIGVLFDNAVEEVRDKEKSLKKIKIELTETNEMISLKVANPAKKYSVSQLEQFFEEGYSTKGDGRGLGLSRIRKLLSKQGSEISVENKEEDGQNLIQFGVILKK